MVSSTLKPQKDNAVIATRPPLRDPAPPKKERKKTMNLAVDHCLERRKRLMLLFLENERRIDGGRRGEERRGKSSGVGFMWSVRGSCVVLWT